MTKEQANKECLRLNNELPRNFPDYYIVILDKKTGFYKVVYYRESK